MTAQGVTLPLVMNGGQLLTTLLLLMDPVHLAGLASATVTAGAAVTHHKMVVMQIAQGQTPSKERVVSSISNFDTE